VAAARADTRTAAKPTADQMRVVKMLEQLAGAADWRGVVRKLVPANAQRRRTPVLCASWRAQVKGACALSYKILLSLTPRRGASSGEVRKIGESQGDSHELRRGRQSSP